MKKNKRILCVMVTFEPKVPKIKEVIRAIELQIDELLLIDNGSSNFDQLLSFLDDISNVRVERMSSNKGLPYAQNLGVLRAKELNMDYVLFLDQDSR